MAQLAEARRRPVPEEVRTRLRARLAAETGALGAPDGSPAPADGAAARPVAARGSAGSLSPASVAFTPGRLAALALALFGGGVAVGVMLDRGLRPQAMPVPSFERPAPTLAVSAAPTSAPPAPSGAPTAAPPVVAALEPPRPVEVAAVAAPAVDDSAGAQRRSSRGAARDTGLAAERAALEIARTAIARRDSRTALEALERHVREAPHGRLVEERESLFVQALVQAGRGADARERAARFRRRFPESLLLPAVEAAVAAGGAHR